MLLVATLVATPFVAFATAEQARVEHEERAVLNAEAEQLQTQWRRTIQDAAQAMVLLQAVWASPAELDDQELQNLTGVLVSETPALERIVVLNAESNVTWTSPPLPRPAGELEDHGSWAYLLELAADPTTPVVSEPMHLQGETSGVAIAIALPSPEDPARAEGYAVGLLPSESLEEALQLESRPGAFRYSIALSEDAVEESVPPDAGPTALAPLSLHGLGLRQSGESPILVVASSEPPLATTEGRVPIVIGIIGVVLGIGAGGVAWLGMERRHEKMETRHRIAESERHYRALFHNAGELIFLLDAQGRFLDANPATLHALGYSLDQIRRLRIHDLLDAAQRERIEELISEAKTATTRNRVPLRLIAKRGDRIECYGTITSVRDPGRTVLQAHLADITRLRGLEEDLREANAALEERVADLDAFARTVAHDLKNPIRAVASYAAFLETDEAGRMSDEGRHDLAEIQEAAERMRALVDALLLYASAGGHRYPVEPVAVESVVAEALKDLEPLIREREAKIAVSPGLPRIVAQRIPLKQVFANLVSNAIKHNDAPRPEVLIDVQPLGADEWEFVVEDNGPGIPPDERERVFDLFRRGSGTRASGSGVGLSIVQRIVWQHGGRTWIEPRPEGGTRTHFTIRQPEPRNDGG